MANKTAALPDAYFQSKDTRGIVNRLPAPHSCSWFISTPIIHNVILYDWIFCANPRHIKKIAMKKTLFATSMRDFCLFTISNSKRSEGNKALLVLNQAKYLL
jgi:hypothetical protein